MSNSVTATKARTLVRTVTGEHKLEGGGFPVRRPFPTHVLDHVDPFLLLDEAGPFPPQEDGDMNDHPHRGFETLTYVLSGDFLSHDSTGFKDVFHTGDVEWTTAGSGIVHGGAPITGSTPMRGIQLWVNLPKAKKWIDPKSTRVEAATIPSIERSDSGYAVKVLAGSAEGVTGPVQTTWPILYLHYKLQAGATVSLDTNQAQDVMLYVLRGSIALSGNDNVSEGQLGILSNGDRVEFSNAADGKTELLLLGSEPIGEPVARYGPFVMNEREEVFQAFDDFNNGKFPMPTSN
ncbi:MAG TPA: pirin family protein [Candidatus Kapabacteria bacterium]|nr:pirin family protein [Candidatus Kapabacteria bacterium]